MDIDISIWVYRYIEIQLQDTDIDSSKKFCAHETLQNSRHKSGWRTKKLISQGFQGFRAHGPGFGDSGAVQASGPQSRPGCA